MALIQEFTHGDSYIRINSDGWSGNIIDPASSEDDDRKFQFDLDFTLENGSYGTPWVRTDEDSYGLVNHMTNIAHGVIGVSLEHMGDGWWDGRYAQQFVGTHTDGSAGRVLYPCFGATWDTGDTEPSDLNVTAESMHLNLYKYFSAYAQYAGVSSSPFMTISCDPNCNPILQYIGWITGTFKTEITTDLPLFATDAELLAWCKDPTNPELIATMLNPPEDIEKTAEELYNESQRYYYLRNKFKVSTNGSTYTATINNINAKPYGKGRICLYKKKHTQVGTANSWYSYYLKGADSYNYQFKTAPWNSFRWDDDDTDISAATALNMVNTVGYVKKSATYAAADVEFVVEYADTNIPIFGSEDLADQYVDEEIDIDQSENYDEIQQEEQKHILPPWGEEDVDGDNGTNAQSCEVGHRMFMLSDTRLKDFFDAIYDPTNLQAILDNNGLFGENQMSSILGLTFIPVNANKFATMGSQENIKLGGWDSEVQGQVIQKNNKLWDVGSTFLAPVFNDFRDMEPYQQLFISLPYCGLHALNLSKYLGKTLSVKYACDLGTGQCCAHIYANGVEYDAFDGNMASQRPITAIDQQAYVSAMMRSITGMIDPAVDLVTGAVESGVGAATGQIGMVAAGGSAALGSIPRMAMSAIESKQDLIQKPMTFKGGFFGAIGLFGNQRCHLIVAQRNTVRAVNELALIGYPSGYGGTVSSFSGHLKCASFTLAQGFAGTAEEAAEIVSMMEQGVYL